MTVTTEPASDQGQNQGQPPPDQGAQGDQSKQPPPTAPARPENLPDRYWDPATGVRMTEAAQTLAAFEAEQASRAEAFKDFPEDATKAGDFYKLPEQMLPEGLELPEGTQLEPNTELLNRALPVLHKHQISREAFQDLARAFTGHEVERFKAVQAEIAEDSKKLGANGAQRRQDIASRLSALVGPERAKFVDTSVITSGAVEFFEALLEKVNTQSSVVPLRRGPEGPEAPDPNKPLIDRLADTMYQKKVS